MEKHGSDIQATLAERQVQHGAFADHALIEYELRNMLDKYDRGYLTPVQYIALGMIFHKIARILNKGNRHSDTWHDIAGYATLAEREILSE